MNARTHMAFALACSAPFITECRGAGLMLSIGSCIVGSTLPDCDLLDNQSASIFEELLLVLKHSAIPFAIWAYQNRIDSIARVTEKQRMMLIIWVLLMVATAASPHRGWSHTVEWMAVFGAAWYMITKSEVMTKYLLIGYASHLILDLLNKVPEKLTLLIKKGFCFNLCKADGPVSVLVESMSVVFIAYMMIFK